MSDNFEANGLHLPSLSIRGFRGIGHLDIERLGRVTLLAGRNGIGKTTVLDAVRLYSNQGDATSFRSVLASHQELETSYDVDGDPVERPVLEALFFGRNPAPHDKFSIGAIGGQPPLIVEAVTAADLPLEQRESLGRHPPALGGPILRISCGSVSEFLPANSYALLRLFESTARRMWGNVLGQKHRSDDTRCVSLGPDIVDGQQLAEHWDEIALTSDERLALDALQLACRVEIEGVAPVARPRPSPAYRESKRQMMVKPSQGDRVPLNSLGDGAMRMLGTALGLVNARDGYLIVDEAENGIHHTLQFDYWKMVLRAAREHNVQVLATTHSWDCVAGFARAACEDTASEGVVVRLEPDGGKDGSLRAVEYSEVDLDVVAAQGIEVR